MTNPTLDPGFTSTQDCPHADYELRRRTYANGVVHFVFQCLCCGAAGRSIKKEQAFAAGGASAPAFDDELRDVYWMAERERRREEYSAFWDERRSDYQDYLRSPMWARKRARRLMIDRGRCQAMLEGCTGSAEEVHHLTYEHIQDEPMFDLVSVCSSCHRRLSMVEGRGTVEHDVA